VVDRVFKLDRQHHEKIPPDRAGWHFGNTMLALGVEQRLPAQYAGWWSFSVAPIDLPEPQGLKLDRQHHEKIPPDGAGWHFGNTVLALGELNWHLSQTMTGTRCLVFQVNQKTIACVVKPCQINTFQ
jgi:hypothetical protein